MPSTKKGGGIITFNPDQIRDILIAVSELLIPDEDGFISPIYPIDLVQDKLSSYPRNETLYWIRQLMDSEILIVGKKYIDEPIPHIKDLSLAGYQFIENASKSAIWKQIRPRLISTAFSCLPSFIQSAIELGGKLIAKYSNIHL